MIVDASREDDRRLSGHAHTFLRCRSGGWADFLSCRDISCLCLWSCSLELFDRPKPRDESSAADATSSNGNSATTAVAFDPRDMLEAVDLVEKLRKTEFASKLALDKWSEKVSSHEG